MKRFTPSALKTIRSHKKPLVIGAGVIAGLIALTMGGVLLVESQKPKIVYEPVNACALLTTEEAAELLGSRTLRSDAKEPIVTENVATSRCGYTDGAADITKMRVAAIIVRSAINDDGIDQNDTEFAESKNEQTNEAVENIGESAFFNPVRGQLNVLDGTTWTIMSYGVGETPQANTVEDAVQLARKVIPSESKTAF